MRIRDKIALGTLAGLVASIPQLILNFFFVSLGISAYYSFQLSAGVFVRDHQTTITLGGLLLGGLLWEFASAFLGVLIVYVLHFTGREYWWLKGILSSISFMYILIFGFIFDMGIARIIPQDIGSNFAILFENALFGIIASYLVFRWGDYARS